MWTFEENNKILYFVSKNFVYQKNMIIFSLNRCLINETISNEMEQGVQLYDPMQTGSNVLPFLKHVSQSMSLIIIENLPYIDQEVIKKSVCNFFELINNEINQIPFIMLFSLCNNRFKKPFTHSFNKIKELYFSNSKAINLNDSIVIGPNAGRIKTYMYNADISDHDRAFAANIGINNFRTPNQIFCNDKTPRQWQWKYDVINDIMLKQKTITEISLNNIFNKDVLTNKKCFIVFIAGPPSSGKSCLGNRVKAEIKNISPYDTVILDIGAYNKRYELAGTFQRCISSGINSINNDSSNIDNNISSNITNIIVIDFLENSAKRNVYFNFINSRIQDIDALYANVYIEIDTTRTVCEFLNKFDLQISKKNKELYRSYDYNEYYKSYSEFSSIQKIPIKFMKFPLKIYLRKELFYHY